MRIFNQEIKYTFWAITGLVLFLLGLFIFTEYGRVFRLFFMLWGVVLFGISTGNKKFLLKQKRYFI